MIFKSFFRAVSRDIAIDLGTATTLIYVQGEGIVLYEPSVVAIADTGKGYKKAIAVGTEAKKMLGRTPGRITAIRPLKDGVIADFEITEAMLRHFIGKVMMRRYPFIRPRVVISVPSGVTEVERRAVRESTESAGAREVYLLQEPIAAAMGANLPITEPVGNMIVDIGGGTTEVAVISLGGIVESKSIKIAGDEMDDAIVQYIRRNHNMLIGLSTAEKIKIEIGNAYPLPETKELIIKGRNLSTGIPGTLKINSEEIRESLSEPINQIVSAVLETLEKTPPELSADIIERGIFLSGGGSLLKNFDILLREATGVPVFLAPEPLFAVVNGAGKVLDNIPLLKDLSMA